MESTHNDEIATRWGLDKETIQNLGQRLHHFWDRFHKCFVTARHDTSKNALTYIKGLLLLPIHYL